MKKFEAKCAKNVVAQIKMDEVIYRKRFDSLSSRILKEFVKIHPEYSGCEIVTNRISGDMWTFDIVQLSDVMFDEER